MTTVTEAVRSDTGAAEVPFPGLDPFGAAHAPYFFGRDRDRKLVVANLRASRLTVLYGESGVGKSSVLLAGVQRELRRRVLDNLTAQLAAGKPAVRAPFAAAVFRSWVDDPLPRLMEHLRLAAVEALGGAELEPWRGGSVLETLQAWTERCRYLLLILDQFEEYFLYHPPSGEPGSFDVELARMVDEPALRVHVLLSLREDALALLDRFKPTIPKLYDNYLRIDHLDLKAAREAIEAPIGAYNELFGAHAEIEPELVETLLAAPELRASRAVAVEGARRAAAAAGEATPRIETSYLQLILRRLWLTETENDSDILRKATLDELGGLQRITRRHLDEAMDALAGDGRRELAVDVFHHLVTPSKTKMAHTAADLAEYVERPEDEVRELLDRLCLGNRILRRLIPPPDPDAPAVEPEPRYEIFHDVLADAILAWREERLAERRTRAEHAAAERALQEELAREAQRREAALAEAERSEQAARKARRGAVVSLALAVAAVGGLVAAVILGLSASHAKDAARSEELAAAARADAALDPARSVSEALQALNVRSNNADAELALRETLPALRLRAVLPNRGFVRNVVFAGARDQYAVVSSTIGGVRLWDWRNRRELARLSTDGDTTVAVAARGTKLLTVDRSNTAEIWDVGRCAAERSCSPIVVPTHPAYTAAISADGSRAAVLGGTEGPQLTILDCSARCRPTGLSVPLSLDSPPTMVALSSDGALVALGSTQSNEIDVWRLNGTSSTKTRLLGSWSSTSSLAFARQGERLVASGDKLAQAWNVSRCRGRPSCPPFRTVRHADAVNSAAFSPDGHELVTASTDGTARVWDAGTVVAGSALLELHGHAGAVVDAAFSADGRSLITGSSDQTARVWDVTTGRVLRGNTGAVSDAEFSPDGRSVVTAGADRTARIFDARSGVELAVFSWRSVKRAGSDFEMQSAAFSRDGSRIVTAPRFGAPIVSSVRVCERHRSSVTCGTGRELDTSTDYHGVRNAVFAPNGRVVAAATAHGLYMFDVRSGHVLAVRNPGRDTTRVAFSRDGDYLALAGPDGSVRLYDVRGCGPAACHPRLVKPLPRVRGAVYSVSFSPDDTLLATGGADRIVRIWDWRKARPLQLRGHTSNIRAVSFDDSGKYLVSAGTDGATILWSVVHARGKFGGKLLELLHMHADRIRSAVFAPGSSTTLLTASDDGTARIYVCDLCRPLEDVENIAHSRLRAVDRPATWLKNDRPSG